MEKIVGQVIIVVAAIIAATTLIYFDKDGWGWFVAIAIIALLG